MLETLWKASRKGEIEMAWCQSILVDEYGTPMESVKVYHNIISPGAFENSFVACGDEIIRNHLCRRNIIHNASAAICSRAQFLRAGLSNTKMKYSGDWFQWIMILQSCKIAFVSEELNYFRSHSITTRASGKIHIQLAEDLACMISAIYSMRKSHQINILTESRNIGIVSTLYLLESFHDPSFREYFLSSLSFSSLLSINKRLEALGSLAILSNSARLLILFMLIFRSARTLSVTRPLWQIRRKLFTKISCNWPIPRE